MSNELNETKSISKTTIVLLSGGLDSTACIAFYKDIGFYIIPLFIDYGQRPAEKEHLAAKKISKYFGINLNTLKLSHKSIISTGELSGRNALFVLSALLTSPNFNGIISLGIHSGTDYYDCTPQFVSDLQRLIDGYASGKVLVGAPFIKWYKKDIYRYAKDKALPIGETYSCENGFEQPCGYCSSCLERSQLDV